MESMAPKYDASSKADAYVIWSGVVLTFRLDLFPSLSVAVLIFDFQQDGFEIKPSDFTAKTMMDATFASNQRTWVGVKWQNGMAAYGFIPYTATSELH
jgi:hypothetical protein